MLKVGDRFKLGSLVGMVRHTGTYVEVQFDQHKLHNNFDPDFLNTHATKIEPPIGVGSQFKPTSPKNSNDLYTIIQIKDERCIYSVVGSNGKLYGGSCDLDLFSPNYYERIS